MRIYNDTGFPDIEIEPPSQSSTLTYFNLTVTDVHTEAGQINFTQDSFERYFDLAYGAYLNKSHWQLGIPITSSIMGCTYGFEINSIYGAIFLEDISLLLNNPNTTHGVDFTLFILRENATGYPDTNPWTFFLVQNFTAPAGGVS